MSELRYCLEQTKSSRTDLLRVIKDLFELTDVPVLETLHDVYLPLERFRNVLRRHRTQSAMRDGLPELTRRDDLHRVPGTLSLIQRLHDGAEGTCSKDGL